MAETASILTVSDLIFLATNVTKKLDHYKISIRHRLTDDLKRYGGHIGYDVRYSEWNKGYGTLMLRLALEKAKT